MEEGKKEIAGKENTNQSRGGEDREKKEKRKVRGGENKKGKERRGKKTREEKTWTERKDGKRVGKERKRVGSVLFFFF